MFELINSMSEQVISRHKTLKALAKAKAKHAKTVTRNNGENSYIPYSYAIDGEALTYDQRDEFLGIEWQMMQQGEI